MSIKLNAKSFKNLLETIVREEQEKIEVSHETMNLQQLEQENKKAYDALPSSYQNDSALIFYYDNNNHLCAEHDLGGDFIWTGRKWLEMDDAFGKDNMLSHSRQQESKRNNSLTLNETIKYRELVKKHPKAAQKLPYSIRNDPSVKFTFNDDKVVALSNGRKSTWDGFKWTELKETKKITLGQVKRIIKEEVARFSLKQTLKEVFKRNCKINEAVNFAALKKELESGFDHFRAENPDIKVGDFNWDNAIKGLMQDDEARQMMKVGDADGLVNKAIELAGVENPVADVDVEKHTDDAFGDLQGDEKVDDSDVDAAFDNIQRKSA
jgi:hypothetical protein